jgi:hypothetical protein
MAVPAIELLRELNDIVAQAQRIVAEWEGPGEVACREARDKLVGLFDGQELRRIQEQVSETVDDRPSFFTTDRENDRDVER